MGDRADNDPLSEDALRRDAHALLDPEIAGLVEEALSTRWASPRGAIVALGISLEDLLFAECVRRQVAQKLTTRDAKIQSLTDRLVVAVGKAYASHAAFAQIKLIQDVRNRAVHGGRARVGGHGEDPTEADVRTTASTLLALAANLPLLPMAPAKSVGSVDVELTQALHDPAAMASSSTSASGAWAAFGWPEPTFLVQAAEGGVVSAEVGPVARFLAGVDLAGRTGSLVAADDGRVVVVDQDRALAFVEVASDGDLHPWRVAGPALDGEVTAANLIGGDLGRPDQLAVLVVHAGGETHIVRTGRSGPVRVEDGERVGAWAVSLVDGVLTADIERVRTSPEGAERWDAVDSAVGGGVRLWAAVQERDEHLRVQLVRRDGDALTSRRLRFALGTGPIKVVRPVAGEVPGAIAVEVDRTVHVISWDRVVAMLSGDHDATDEGTG